MSDHLTTSMLQLSRLLAQGMVTHILSSPGDGMVWSIDPFTVRDVKELKLMVILDDGTVAIHCPDGLPDSMTDAAMPLASHPGVLLTEDLSVRATAPQDTDKFDELLAALAKIEVLSDRVEGVEHALTAALRDDLPDDATNSVLDRLDEIAATLQTFAEPPAPEPTGAEIGIADQLGVLLDAVAQISDAHSGTLTSQQFQHALVDLGQRIDASHREFVKPEDLTCLLDRMRGAADFPEMTAKLDQLTGKIDGLIRMPQPRLEMAPIHQALARQSAALATVVRRIEATLADVQPQRVPPDDAVVLGLGSLRDAINRRNSPEPWSMALMATTEKLAQDVAKLAMAASMPPIASAGPSEFVVLRQQLARHATAHATVLRRLEAVVDRLSEHDVLAGQKHEMCDIDTPVLTELAAIRSLLETDPIAPHYPPEADFDCSDDFRAFSPDLWMQKISAMDHDGRIALAEEIATVFRSAETRRSKVS